MSLSKNILRIRNRQSDTGPGCDVPARMHSQSGLRVSELRYRRLFEAARDGILILDALTLKITEVNPFMTELLGYSHAEFLGKELWEIGLFSDKAASQEAFQELQRTGYLRYEDLPLQANNGKLRDVEFVSNVYDEDNHQVIQCNIRDITDRKRAEEERTLLLASAQAARAEADAANAMKDEFLTTLSHELRTPLTSILGWSHLLTVHDLDKQETARAIEIIARNTRVQRRLIDDLLDVSRIITGKLCLDVRAVKLAPLIKAVVDDLRPTSDARGITLLVTLDSDIPDIPGDSDRLQQVIWNLLSNAIKFTPRSGNIQVLLERGTSDAVITINDTGKGMAPEILPYVFDRFRQADASNTRTSGGLGLGLSIVRQLVELHRGTVTAESPGEDQGSSVRVTLPLTTSEESNSIPKVNLKEGRDDRAETLPLVGLCILVVDDEPDSCEFISTVLTTSGAEVVSVSSASQALYEIKQQRFDLLFSDIGMPEMNGYDLIKQVRQLPESRGGKTPAAALTAYAGRADRTRVLAAGYEKHIPKPVEPAELIRVATFLSGRHNSIV